MSYRETLFASLEVKKPQVAPKIKTVRISKAPYSPIAGPASPHAGVSAWFLFGGWCGVAWRPFSRASLGVLRPARTLGLVGLVWQALDPCRGVSWSLLSLPERPWSLVLDPLPMDSQGP